MVVQHNMQAMNSSRMLNITTAAQGKSTEKLSSGYRINRAADDAAGLSISEKMRKQIRGLDRASTNAEDGVSAVQTAEGALNEVHDMLQRMNELAVQAANGTNSESDRQAIQNEIDQLTSEMDRIAETTKFNETYLLKGAVDSGTKAQYLEPKTAGLLGKMGEMCAKDLSQPVTFTVNELTIGDKVTIGGIQYSIIDKASLETDDVKANKINVETAYNYMAAELVKANSIGTYDVKENSQFAGAQSPIVKREDNVFTITPASITTVKELSFNLHVGSDSAMSNKIIINIDKMDSNTLGIKGLDVVGKKDETAMPAPDATSDIDWTKVIGTTPYPDQASDKANVSAPGTAATYAIDAIAQALQKVSNQRSELGAIQNRLEHSIANLDNVVENTTAAESRIRDTDMADEMVRYSKNNILAQAGQSMLAQANQSTQGVLSLLQ